VNGDKSATPLLDQLCQGIAKVIVCHPKYVQHLQQLTILKSQLEPGPDTELTPQRLATFYKSIGGNDFVFRELGYPGLSLMYRTLGCFHSLQPSDNPFESPSVPCLLVPGFVRWQTLQLLLHPDEHARCFQKAVEMYDIPRPDGGHFPKTIPREAFPAKPDEAMEKWQAMVLERLDDGHKRLKNSPYASPYDAPERGDGYFPRGSPHARRPSRPPRTNSQDLPHRLSASSRRRSSVPNIPSPIQPPDAKENYHYASDQAYSAPNSAIPRSPKLRPSTSSSQRPPSQSYHRPSNSHSTKTDNVTSNTTSNKLFGLNFDNFHIPFISSPFNSTKNRDRSSTSAAKDNPRPRSPRPRSEAVSTGSEASSEDSLPKIPKYDRDHRRASLAPPSAEYNRYQRRHSHDASYLQNQMHMPASPPQPRQDQNPYHQQAYVPPAAPVPPNPPNPHPQMYRNDLFDNLNGQGASSAPESPIASQPANPKLRFIDPTGRDQSNDRGRTYHHHRHSGPETLLERRAASADRRSASGDRRVERTEDWRHADNSDRSRDAEREKLRREGRPLRINTVAGPSSGRRVRPEVRSAGSPNLRRVPPMSLSGSARR
jgi:hypothetical protein